MPTYEVIEGRHSEGRGRTRKVYKRGDRVTTPVDLEKKLNRPGYPPKFRRVDGVLPSQKLGPPNPGDPYPTQLPPPQTHGMDTLEAMTVEELRKYAAEEEIDLGPAKTKADILKAIKAGLE